MLAKEYLASTLKFSQLINMKYALITSTFLFPLSLLLQAGNLSVSITPFQSAEGFLEERQFRFLQTETLVPVEQNTATHILIEGLLPVSADTPHVVSSSYTAININTGAEQDKGHVLLELPPSTPEEGVVTSPIVGIVQRNGSWSQLNTSPVPSNVGNSMGSSVYDPVAKTIQFSLQRTVNNVQENIAGTASYSTDGQSTLILSPFSLTVNQQTFDFPQTILYRNGRTFAGELPATLPPTNFDPNSALYFLSLIDNTDSDADNIPDLIDADAPSETWLSNAVVQPDGSYSNWNGQFYLLESGKTDRTWTYHTQHGFWYVHSNGKNSAFFFDYQLNWVWTANFTYPFIYRFHDNSWYFFFNDSGGAGKTRYFSRLNSKGEWEFIGFPVSGE